MMESMTNVPEDKMDIDVDGNSDELKKARRMAKQIKGKSKMDGSFRWEDIDDTNKFPKKPKGIG
jgi:hypothetical protein